MISLADIWGEEMSRYEKLSKRSEDEQPVKMWDRFGFSESEWKTLSTDNREVHYNRRQVCDHPYSYPGIPIDKERWDKTNETLRDQMSFDPYAHTAHMDVCTKDDKCFCQMCANNIGIARGQKREFKPGGQR